MRIISLIITLIYLIESTGLNCLPSITQDRRDALRPISSAIPPDSQQIRNDIYPTVIRGKAEHTIAGIDHYEYPSEDIDWLIKGKDKVTFEGFRRSRYSLVSIIYRIAQLRFFVIERIQSLCTGKRRSQKFYVGKLVEEGNENITLDVFFRRPTPISMKLAIFNILYISSALAMVLGLTCLPWLIIPALILSAFTVVYIIFLAQLFDPAISTVTCDFRELVHATKLAYLPELFKKSDLKTVTIVGYEHRQGIMRYLQDDEARGERWQEYASNPWLRLRLRYYLDIEKSMDICRETAETEGLEVIGTIAGLPGPKQLIEAMKFKAKPPTRTDRIAARIMLYSPPVLLVFAILAVLIKLSSKGPVFFKQPRVGHNGKTIMVWKFRTWTNEPDETKRKLTLVGYIIGVLRLDEWAQLLNIIKGEMKFYGPRPLIRDQVNDEYKKRVLSIVWPGLIGSSVPVRMTNSLDGLPAIDTIDFDIKDALNYSFLYNASLAIRTFYVIFRLGLRMFINGKQNSTRDRVLNTLVNRRPHLNMTTEEVKPKEAATGASNITRAIEAAFEAYVQLEITPASREQIVPSQTPEAGSAALLQVKVDTAVAAAA